MQEEQSKGVKIIKLEVPNADGNVWPQQVCLAYVPREDANSTLRQCWYCRHADFHLNKPRSLEVGVCYWPNIILK